MTIIKRADLGRPLTWDELDDNFQQVDNLTAAASAAVSSAAASATAAAGSAANSLNSANNASSFAADASASATVAINALMNSAFEPSGFDFTTGGTLTATDRNVAVYNSADNNWYSWSGTLPHTVDAGMDPTADSNWVPRTDQLLRQDLASNDGLKLIGKCPDLTTLRTIEPTVSGQSIILERAVADGPLVNAVLTYDASDTTSTDDGFSVFVTTNGARWKADISSGYDIRLAGYIPGVSDLATTLNSMAVSIIKGIVSAGGYSNQQSVITIPAATVLSSETSHKVGATIYLPTLVSLKFTGGTHYLKATTDATAIIWGNNYFVTNYSLTWSMVVSGYSDSSKLRTNAFKRKLILADSQVVIKGLGKGLSSTSGVILGETSNVSNAVSTSDVVLSNLVVSGFANAFQPGSVNTYNLYIDQCYFDGIEYAWYMPNGSSVNSGETVHCTNSTLSAGVAYSNTTGSIIYSDLLAYNVAFSNCHLDYAVDSVLELGPHATYSNFTFDKCWIEGFNNLVNCDAMYTGDIPTVNLTGCLVDLRSADGTTWGGPRKVLSSGSSYSLFIDETTEFNFYRSPGANGPTVALCGTDSLSSSVRKFPSFAFSNTASKRKRPYPIDISNSIRGLALFSGTEGATGISSNDTSQLLLSTSGSPTVLYGPAKDMADTFQSLAITMSATTDIVYIYPRHKVLLQRGDAIAASCSIKLNNAAGNVNVSACLFNYYSETLAGTVSDTAVTIARTANLYGTVQGGVVEDALTYLAVSGTSLTTDDFVGVEPVWVSQGYTLLTSNSLTVGYEYSLPALKITGFTGTIYLSLPFWWRL